MYNKNNSANILKYEDINFNLSTNTSIILKNNIIEYKYKNHLIKYKLRSYNDIILNKIINNIIDDKPVNNVFNINGDLLLSIDNLRHNEYYEYLIINDGLVNELKYNYNIFYKSNNIYNNCNVCINVNEYTNNEILNMIQLYDSVILMKNMTYHLIYTIFNKEIIFNDDDEIKEFIKIEYTDKTQFKMKWGYDDIKSLKLM